MNTESLSKRVSDLEKRVEAIEASISTSVSSGSPVQKMVKQMSAKEFLISKKLSSAVEKTLALAYYLELVEQVGSFNINDLTNAFQMAREKSPANLNDMINKNIAKGYLMEARERKDAKKAWILTSTGEKYVEGDLNK